MISSKGNDRLSPRTYGITQKEQRLSQPSCTLRLGRVRSLAASKTGAARSSVWAKMSATKIGLWTFSARAVSGMKAEPSGAKALSTEAAFFAALEALRHPKSFFAVLEAATVPALAPVVISTSEKPHPS